MEVTPPGRRQAVPEGTQQVAREARAKVNSLLAVVAQPLLAVLPQEHAQMLEVLGTAALHVMGFQPAAAVAITVEARHGRLAAVEALVTVPAVAVPAPPGRGTDTGRRSSPTIILLPPSPQPGPL